MKSNCEHNPTANPTYILGIDIGYSEKRETCCSCALELKGRTILLKEKPNRFSFPGTLHMLERLRDDKGVYPAVVGVDAPLTPRLIQEKPTTGRAVDKLFSRGEFSNGKRGPQPGSIATPMQGWPLYNAGMTFIGLLGQVFPRIQYIRLSEPKKTWHGAIEVFPKLTQTVLLPRSSIAERPTRANIDEHLFPRLFLRHQDIIRRTLRGLAIDSTVTDFVNEVSARPSSHHEELAAFVAAFQGLLCLIGSARAIGRTGDFEGYFALPRREFWHEDWRSAYNVIDRNDCVEVTIEGNFT